MPDQESSQVRSAHSGRSYDDLGRPANPVRSNGVLGRTMPPHLVPAIAFWLTCASPKHLVEEIPRPYASPFGQVFGPLQRACCDLALDESVEMIDPQADLCPAR